MRTPTEILRDEHRVILKALDALEHATENLSKGDNLPPGWWEQLAAWLRGFADRSHHAKEERSLFPAMVKAGVPSEGGPIAVMLEEHEQGRALVRAMEAVALSERTAAARKYVRLLRDHIAKENDVLFPMAEAVLEGPALAVLGREFEVAEAELGPQASLERAEAALERLLDGGA